MEELQKKIIGKRINTLLAEKNTKQKELAKAINVSDNQISYFVSGTRTPNTEQIIQIAKYFNVSSDYILGLRDTPTNDGNIQFIEDYTGLNKKIIDLLNLETRVLSSDYLTMFTDSINYFIEGYIDHLFIHINDNRTHLDEFNNIVKQIKQINGTAIDSLDLCNHAIMEYRFAKLALLDAKEAFSDLINDFSSDVYAKTNENLSVIKKITDELSKEDKKGEPNGNNN